MTWDHRIVAIRHKGRSKSEGGTETIYGIHEVYYDERGKLSMYTTEPVLVSGNSVSEVAETLGLMIRATLKPVLNPGDFLKPKFRRR